MFTGLVTHIGTVSEILISNKKDTKLKINIEWLDDISLGSSISCNGVCLTIEKILKNKIFFYISNETLKRTNFRELRLNQIINIEKSLTYGQSISGHFIQGHVDTVAKVKKITFADKSWIIKLQILDKKLNRYLMEKASISLNGVSLTISKVYNNFFEINIIPHTLYLTNLKKLKPNNLVNVELDILSKYIYKYSN